MNHEPQNGRPAVTGLAIVGFIALVAAGMWLAVYSARYVPGTVSRIGSAAVALSSIFNSATSSPAVVAVTSTSTVPLGTDYTATSSTPVSTPSDSGTGHTVTTTAGQETSGSYQISGTTSGPLSGLPDLVVSITAVGYLTTNTADSFVTANSVPSGMRPAVKFTIKNIGTNIAGPWRFSASIPTQTLFIYQSPTQQSLSPGDSIDYTLGFDQANRGNNQTISITANFDHVVAESNTTNNSTAATISVQ